MLRMLLLPERVTIHIERRERESARARMRPKSASSVCLPLLAYKSGTLSY